MAQTFLLLLVFLFSLLVTGLWLGMARRQHWFDFPNQRSSHEQPVPKSGGAGFVVAYSLFLFCLVLIGDLETRNLLLLFTALPLALTGFVDDLRNLGVGVRIGMQVAMAALAAWLCWPLPPLQLPGFVLQSQIVLVPVFLLGMAWLVNLYNFMDGIDALAACQAVFVSMALTLLSSLQGGGLLLPCLGLAASVSAFLYYNLPPARLFMGDLGSNYLGFLLGILGILAIQAGAINYWTLLVLLGVFIVDASTTLLGRIRRGALWYHAHRSHAYQCAARKYGSHGKVVLLVLAIDCLWLLPLAWMTTEREQWGLQVLVIAWLPLVVLARHYRKAEVEPVIAATEGSRKPRTRA